MRDWFKWLCLSLAVCVTAISLSGTTFIQAQDDPFATRAVGLGDPGANYFAITPHNSTNFAVVTRGIYVGGDGNVVAIDQDDTAVTFVGCVAGTVLPIRAKRVNSTSTTATNLVGIW